MDVLGPVRAAGGVVWRHGPRGQREVMLVHRPRHDDWTLPKGKLEPAEHPLVAAVREVWEETGVRAKAGVRLPTVHYDVWARSRGGAGGGLVEKTVDYWAMTAVADEGFTAGQETDIRAWFDLPEALTQLSYTHDRKVLTAFAGLPSLREPVLVLRHVFADRLGANAGHDALAGRDAPAEPDSPVGPDAPSRVDHEGAVRAATLAQVLRCFDPTRLVAAPGRRCVQTLGPLAATVRLPIEVEPLFDEMADPTAAATALQRYACHSGARPHAAAASGRVTPRLGGVVVCGPSRLVASILAALSGGAPSSYCTAEGAAWALFFADHGDHPDTDEVVSRSGLAALDLLP